MPDEPSKLRMERNFLCFLQAKSKRSLIRFARNARMAYLKLTRQNALFVLVGLGQLSYANGKLED